MQVAKSSSLTILETLVTSSFSILSRRYRTCLVRLCISIALCRPLYVDTLSDQRVRNIRNILFALFSCRINGVVVSYPEASRAVLGVPTSVQLGGVGGQAHLDSLCFSLFGET